MARSKPVRVLLCNRYALFREGIKALLPEGAAIEVIGEAATAKQALNLVERRRPDVVLLDATTADSSGSDLTRRIKAIDPHVEVLILSLYDDHLLISSCLDAGAAGYVRNVDKPRQLRQAICTACRRTHRAA